VSDPVSLGLAVDREPDSGGSGNAERVLECHEISKRYGSVQGLGAVSLAVGPGEIVGLAGDNGAGKSTLLRILGGATKPTSGTVLLAGDELRTFTPAYARAQGIEMVYQDLALCPNLSVSANVFLGREESRTIVGIRVTRRRQMDRQTVHLLDRVGVRISDVEELVGNLSGGQRQAVAICRALASKPKVILLDEPTAALSVNAVAPLLELIRRLPSEGVSVVLVSHRLSDLLTATERIVVMRRGNIVTELQSRTASEGQVLRLMAGLET
jgi:ABC-type sugar transport system ATPase subunit